MNYHNIQTYDELLQTNLDFFKGKIDSTFYYHEKWTYEEDHFSSSTSTLVELTHNNVFTFNGQSPSPNQRSYVEFLMPSEMVEKIYAYMEVDPRIWVQFEWKNGLLWSSIDSKKIALTRTDKKKVCTEWHNAEWQNVNDGKIGNRIGGLWDYPNIEKILSEMVYGVVICRDFNKDNAEQILLDWISKKNKMNLFDSLFYYN